MKPLFALPELGFSKVGAVLLGAAVMGFGAQAHASDTKIPAGVFINQQSSDQYLARDNLLGAKVLGPDGKIIGDIEDLIINEYNLVTGVVIGTGGFLGLAEKKIGVNVSSLKFEDVAGKTTINLPEATPDVLAAVEAYKPTQPQKSVMERAQEKAQELTDKATASAKAATESARPAIDDAVVKTHEAYSKAKEAAAPALEAAKEAVNSAIGKASEAVDGMTK
jgi:sporulation protein YlmC with PRC-barrel domain